MDPRVRRQREDDSIRLDDEGNWFQGEYPILHDRTIQFLYKNIVLDDDGRYYLTGEDKPVYFRVDDAAYFITRLERTIAGYLITLTDDTVELLDLNSLWIGKKNALYCLVKGGRIPAKFLRARYYEFVQDMVKKENKYSIRFNRKDYPIRTTMPKEAATLLKTARRAKARKEKKKRDKRKKARIQKARKHQARKKPR